MPKVIFLLVMYYHFSLTELSFSIKSICQLVPSILPLAFGLTLSCSTFVIVVWKSAVSSSGIRSGIISVTLTFSDLKYMPCNLNKLNSFFKINFYFYREGDHLHASQDCTYFWFVEINKNTIHTV